MTEKKTFDCNARRVVVVKIHKVQVLTFRKWTADQDRHLKAKEDKVEREEITLGIVNRVCTSFQFTKNI